MLGNNRVSISVQLRQRKRWQLIMKLSITSFKSELKGALKLEAKHFRTFHSLRQQSILNSAYTTFTESFLWRRCNDLIILKENAKTAKSENQVLVIGRWLQSFSLPSTSRSKLLCSNVTQSKTPNSNKSRHFTQHLK